MIPKSLSKISLVSFGNIFNAVLGFLFLSTVAKTLTIADFGKYALLTSLLVSLSKIIDFGTNSIFVAKSITNENKILNTFLSLKIVLFIICVPISFAFLYFLKIASIENLILFFYGLVFYGINITLFAFFQRDEKFNFAVLINTVPASIKGLFAVLILSGIIRINVTQAFAIFSISMLASAIFLGRIASELRSFKFSTSGVTELLHQSLFAGFSQLVSNGWSAISNSIAKIVKTFTDVGIFSLADKIASIFSLVSISIFTVLLPKNAARKRDKQNYDFKETIIIAGGILAVSFLTTLVAGFFVDFVFKGKYEQSIPLINILVIASALTAIHTFIENYFYVEEKTHQLFYITLTKLAVFFIACFLLIPSLALKGLALAQLCAAAAALIATLSLIIIRPAKS
ncbi:MAG TPA: oligosaccharide flippase family protein [Candidatus Saccharimonadales bacterium]|nr:oligosaccharide flippase family protein [Candidatus Saccharimonadales bacterium]